MLMPERPRVYRHNSQHCWGLKENFLGRKNNGYCSAVIVAGVRVMGGISKSYEGKQQLSSHQLRDKMQTIVYEDFLVTT